MKNFLEYLKYTPNYLSFIYVIVLWVYNPDMTLTRFVITFWKPLLVLFLISYLNNLAWGFKKKYKSICEK